MEHIFSSSREFLHVSHPKLLVLEIQLPYVIAIMYIVNVMNRQKIEKGSNYWSIVTQSIKPIFSSIYVGRGNIPAPFFLCGSKLYILSTLNDDLIFWHPQWILVVVKY